MFLKLFAQPRRTRQPVSAQVQSSGARPAAGFKQAGAIADGEAQLGVVIVMLGLAQKDP